MLRRSWQLLGLCGLLVLLCGTLMAGAYAVGPGELQLDLTYANVPVGTTGVKDGDPVAAGSVALTEDGNQVEVDGKLLTEISNGSVTLSYSFDPAKTYRVEVQEAKTAPYYEAKTIELTAAQIQTAISIGVTVQETVNWVEWGKPIQVTLEDSMGSPAPAGTQVTITVTDAEIYQVVEVTKETDADGRVVFRDFSYDPNDPSMCNIYHGKLFLHAQYTDPATSEVTTVAQFYDLEKLKTNILTLDWPSVTVSGKVLDSDGRPAANQRVAAYFDLGALQDEMLSVKNSTDLPDYSMVGDFPLQGRVYYTTTAADGSYTLALPRGVTAALCVANTEINPGAPVGKIAWHDIANYDYAQKASVHFPWVRTMFYKGDTGPLWYFAGIQCKESAAVSCVPYGAQTGVDLSMGRDKYTMTGTVTSDGETYSGGITFTLTNTASAGGSSLHKGAILETKATWNVVNGVIDKTDVKLVPGVYQVSLSPVKVSNGDLYSGYEPLTVTVSASDVAAGTVALGALDFAPVPKVPYPVGDTTDISKADPTVTGPGRGYLRTRMEQVTDYAYGGNSHQISLYYNAFHTGAAVNELPTATLKVQLPAGVSVNHAGDMQVTGDPTTGITLTKNLSNVRTGETNAIVFSVKVEPTSASNYYALVCYASPNHAGEATEEMSSIVTFQRLKINLNVPRLVAPSTPFRAFGDLTGAGDDTGVSLYRDGQKAAEGAKKGRYYYFDVPGQAPGTYKFYAETSRNGVTETSSPVTVDVANNLPEVADMYIVDQSGTKYGKNDRFNMVYYTAFVNPASLTGDSFSVYVKVDNLPTTADVKLTAAGKTYPASYDAATGYWKAEISGYTTYGDFPLMLTIDGVYTTQIGCLLFLA